MKRSTYPDWRGYQIAITTLWLLRLAKVPGGKRLIRSLRDLPGTRAILRWATGYMRPYATLAEAEAAISGRIANGSHQNPNNLELLQYFNQQLWPSDYAVLYHLRGLISHAKHVFDMGGNVGLQYYLYREYLDMPPDLVWRVYDLPAHVVAGQALAEQRGAHQLRFSHSLRDAEGADVYIASGSLHYIDTTLKEMISELDSQPQYIIVNRTPLRDGPPIATVQDAEVFRMACIVYNRDDLVRDMEAIGYEVVDSWQEPKMSLFIPGYPEYAVPYYSGMLLRRKGVPSTTAAIPHASELEHALL